MHPGIGVFFVRNDGTVFRFCTKKCRKSFHMKRNPRRVKHTLAYRAVQGKVLVNDPAFLVEKKRNRPVRYSRALWAKTMVAMDKLAEIQMARKQRAALERKRAHAIRILSSNKARQMGFSADQNVPIPDISKYDKTRVQSVTAIRATMVHKLNLKYAQRCARKMKEVEQEQQKAPEQK